MADDKENMNTTNRQRHTSTVKPVQKRNVLSKDKPQVKKTEVLKQVHHPPEENSQPRTRRVQENQDKEKLQNLVQQWRAERQARLMSRLMKKTGHGGYSSAVFGTVPALDQENHAPIPKKMEKRAAKTVDPATRSLVHALRPNPEAPKTRRKPPQKALNIEERRSAIHAFAGRSTTVPPRLPSRTDSPSRLRPDRHGTVSLASKEIKETVPKKAPNVDGPRLNSVVKEKFKPLIIRHTLASRLRMEKANPLIGLNVPSQTFNAVNAERALDPDPNKPGPSNARQSRSTSVPAVRKVNLSHANSLIGFNVPSLSLNTINAESTLDSDPNKPGPSNARQSRSTSVPAARKVNLSHANPLMGLNVPSLSLNTINAESTLDPDPNEPGPSNARQSRSTSVPAARKVNLSHANPLMGLNVPSLSLNTINTESTLDPDPNEPGPSNARQRSNSVPAAHNVNLSHAKTPSKVMVNNPQKAPVASHTVPKKSTLAGSRQKKETTSLEKPKASGRKSVYNGVTSKVSSRPSSIRRSLSCIYFNRLDKCDAQKYVIRGQSEPAMKDADEHHSAMKFQGVPSPIVEEPSLTVPLCKRSVTFVTPVANTPGNCYTPEPEVLRKRLVNWLSKHGKSLDNYHHLNWFGIDAKSMSQPHFSLPRPRTPMLSEVSSTTPETPVNETMTLESASESSRETQMETEAVSSRQRSPLAAISLNETVTSSTLHSTPQLDVVKSTESEEKENVGTKELFIPEVLGDLYKLIQLGYPRDQCDEWLVLIRRANKGITNMPQYWECLAALEEARGDFSAAIDCYGRAVVRGAETTQIEASLEVLWDKFSALNVTNTPKKTPSKRKTLDPKQVFTSSIIKFALQQRAVKRLSSDLGVEAVSCNYIVTPVRRSTRKSTCQFKSTPTSQVFSKLEEIAPGVLQAMMFQKNVALEPRE
ncbi:uncharacterized protein [Anabrus simplex]|uniref:uncharacterized protein n=1 Tax=Anabrus simplex TaxID=316456 RepID=UPI0035A3A459